MMVKIIKKQKQNWKQKNIEEYCKKQQYEYGDLPHPGV